jgi:hypothetical protein
MSKLSSNSNSYKLKNSNDILKTLLKEIYSNSRNIKDMHSRTFLKSFKTQNRLTKFNIANQKNKSSPNKNNTNNLSIYSSKNMSNQKILPFHTESIKMCFSPKILDSKFSSSKSLRPQSPISVKSFNSNIKSTIQSFESKNKNNILLNSKSTSSNKRIIDTETIRKMRLNKAEQAKSIKESNRLLRENALIYKEKLKEESIQRIKLSKLEKKIMKLK